MVTKIHIENLYMFPSYSSTQPRIPAKQDRRFHQPRADRKGRCQKEGCDGWLDRRRKDGASYLECDDCEAIHDMEGNLLDSGIDPSDIDRQGRTATEGSVA